MIPLRERGIFRKRSWNDWVSPLQGEEKLIVYYPSKGEKVTAGEPVPIYAATLKGLSCQRRLPKDWEIMYIRRLD